MVERFETRWWIRENRRTVVRECADYEVTLVTIPGIVALKVEERSRRKLVRPINFTRGSGAL